MILRIACLIKQSIKLGHQTLERSTLTQYYKHT